MSELMGPGQLRQQGQQEEAKPALSLRATPGGVPAGMYPQAILIGVHEQPADPVRGYEAGVRWVFEIANGPYRGLKTGRITGRNPTPRNACGRMLAGLTGQPLDMSGDTDLGQLIGRPYAVVVAGTESGGTRVESASILQQ